MDFQIGFNIALGLACFLGGWVLNNIRDAMRDLQIADSALTEKLAAVEVLVAGQYVKRDYLESKMDGLWAKIDHMDQKMDEKFDRITRAERKGL